MTMECPRCLRKEFKHKRNVVRGVHTKDTERFECIKCGRCVYPHEKLPGFTFTFDKG